MKRKGTNTPFLATDHSGICEIIIDGQTGLLVPERDVDALAKKLRYLLYNPDIGPQMAGRGREYVEKKYDIETLNRRLVEIFRQVPGGKLKKLQTLDSDSTDKA